jgi:hypothetical protein
VHQTAPNRSKPRAAALVWVGLGAGIAQVVAGVSMYLAGVYFAPWSFVVSLLVLLACIVAGAGWYRTRVLSGRMSYLQALGVGAVVAVSTGVVYAVYNVVSITFFYPGFLGDMARAVSESMTAGASTREAIAAATGNVTVPRIALGNLVRLSIQGTVLSLVAALFLKKSKRRENLP